MQQNESYDVAVIGGGPAGATTAALIAERGHRVVVLERDRFPRFKIGESLMPATFSTLERLGVLDKLKRTAFPRKYSVQFYSGEGRASAPFYFRENNPHESSVTWQVRRAEFDLLMLDNAAEKGAEVRSGASVRDLIRDGDRVAGVRAEIDGEVVDIATRVVVDASGQSAFVARKMGTKEDDPCLKHASIFTHFQGAVRDQGIDEGATLIIHTRDHESWFWYIPMPDDRVSVGVVGRVDYMLGDRDLSPQQVFERELAICPGLQPRLENASPVFDVQVMRDFSYRSSQIAGDGWVLVGDAFGFLDPIYSSGILLALKSGEFAAEAIHDALAADDPSGARLGAFAGRYVPGMEALKQLVYAFYTPRFSFAHFLKEHPQHRAPIIDLLTGDVFERDYTGLFEDMAPLLRRPSAPAHAETAG